MSSLKGMVALTLLGLSLNAIAAPKCEFKNANELLEAIKKNHPTILKNSKEVEMSKWDVETAGKLINPEIELEGSSDLDESSKFGTSVKIVQTIELGSKRSSRVNLAKSQLAAKKSLTKMDNEELVIDIVQDIYRLRHLNEMIPLYVESIDAFTRIYKKLSKRTSLSAEQQVERETLELAISDYRLKLSNIKVDRTYLRNHLAFFAGVDCSLGNKILPKMLNLNTKPSMKKTTDLNFSKLRLVKEYRDIQKANLSVAQGEAYTNLRVGPTFEVDKDDETVKKAGISISFDLPIFNRNSAGKARARTALSSANMRFEKFKKEASLDLYSWQTQFRKYVSSLKQMDGKVALERKHKKVESLFKRGIISTSMVIESHRQLIEYSSTRNEFEIGAVKALWNIYNHSGEVMKKELK